MKESTEYIVAHIGAHYGLHARPALMLSRLAMRYQSVIEIAQAETGPWINVRSVYLVLKLKLQKGARVYLRANGPDSSDALEQTVQFVENNTNPSMEYG